MKKLILLLLGVLLVGCAGKAVMQNTRKLRIGMTEDEVIYVLGNPDAVKGMGVERTLVYKLNLDRPYWVVLKNNKVSVFGQPGDYDTAAPQTNKIILQTQ